MKKILKGWNWFEIIFLFVSVVVITVGFIVGADRNWLSFVTSICGIFGVMFLAKGLVLAPYVLVVQAILYSILSFTQKYYGEMIIYLALMTPMYTISIITWFKNRNKIDTSKVQINKIKGKEYLYLSFVTIAGTVAFYFILRALNTNELIVSTLSLSTSAVATYLSLRRCSYYAIGFILNDIILIILWSMSMAKHGIGYLPTVICFVLFLINDIYGFIHWKIEEKKQQTETDQISPFSAQQ